MSNVSLLVIFAKIMRHAEEPLCSQGCVDRTYISEFEGKRCVYMDPASLLLTVPLLDGLEGAVNA